MRINKLPILLLVLLVQGCTKFTEVPLPADQISTGVVFNDDSKAGAAARGLYSVMVGSGLYTAFSGGLSMLPGLAADELQSNSSSLDFQEFYHNSVSSTNSYNYFNLWGQLYTYIYQANAIVENLQKSTGVTAVAKLQVGGEARFIRALSYFYLVNLYDSVPLITGTDYVTNSLLGRSSADKVYDLIIEDLQFAQANLGTGQRIRANKWAATALLARVYLYRQQWELAAEQASAVINSRVHKLEKLNNVFLSSSQEAIFQLVQPATNLYTWDGYIFIASSIPNNQITSTLLNAFEENDQRKLNWTKFNTVNGSTYYFPFKYKVNSGTGTVKTEYSTVLRLTEQYLIRAEAHANQDNITDAITDLDSIRSRAGLPFIEPTINKTDLLTAILHERQVELFSEMGHRWFDAKRTGQATALFGGKTAWVPDDTLLPIPFKDIQRNPNLTQNKGYN
jgi:hypothetical protein